MRCGDAPDISNRVFPLLSRPFAGEFSLSTYFDHDPGQGDGFLLTFYGERVTYGNRGEGHNGYDWGGASMPVGTPLLAAVDGTVNFAGIQAPFFCPTLGRTVSDQAMVSIRSDGSAYEARYLHLSRIDVTALQHVARGQVIGLSGNTGCSGGPHLHFGVYTVGGSTPNVAIDPYGWEGNTPDPLAKQPGHAPSIWLWRPGEAPRLQPIGLLR